MSRAISIRQPWAWLIINSGKDIENRTWPTKVRGRVLVHASKGMTRAEYDDADMDAWILATKKTPLPNFSDLRCGGIIGSVEIVDCVRYSPSPWFCGPWGFVLSNPQPLPFRAFKGALGFFEVPE